LPIPDQQGDSVTIDFIGPLLEDDSKNSIIMFTDRLGSDIQLVASQTDISAEELAYLFFDQWYCENGLPSEIVSDDTRCMGMNVKVCKTRNKDQVPQEKP